MKSILRSICFLILLISQNAFGATTLLPPANQCFTDANGAVVAGSINFFFPNTTTPKPTWKDSNQTTLNSQPISLDGNGCAQIYGVGSYRMQLFDGPVVAGVTTGNLLWDAITTDTSAFNSTFWSGLSAGTPNVITITDTGFNATDGTVINFVALSTNTGATTINPSGFGAISVVKDTAAGPVALTGGEITQNNVISVVYSASGNNFHLLNTAIPSASGNSAPLCGATNLKITNDIGTPSTMIDITADIAVTVSPAGVVLNRGPISTSINITTGTVSSTAGGMDGEVPGTSAWIYIFLIDNGSASSALATSASGNGLTPNMPSGYTFKCRLGAMRVDGSSLLLRTIQRGARAQYSLVTASNTAAYPTIASGSTGSVMTPEPVASFVPATAGDIQMIAAVNNGSIVIAMNGTSPFSVNSAAITAAATTQVTQTFVSGVLESTNIFYGSNSASGILYASGWVDQVNAH